MFVNKEKVSQIKENWLSVTWEELATFIGPNAQSYQPSWQKQHTNWKEKGYGGSGLSWSWPALIPPLGIPWAVARKNWLFVGLMVGLIVFVNVIAFIWPKSPDFTFMAFLIPMIAKSMYIQHAVAQVARIKKETPAGPARDAALTSAGGLNMKHGYIAGAVCAVFLLLMVLIAI
ncbi:hypothetical protein [Ottowia thiooxydans]|uniref:hypothetical protein n=1 Tax=Ottowia thiooxydans TaxID=219182 RepID=UPI000491DFF2|nr:hypothetical protein [Ottowia thiooxydans]